MIKIESLKDYQEKDKCEDLIIEIYQLTKSISKDYPNYKEWFFYKQLPRTFTNEGNILFIRNPNNINEIIGIISLKKTNEEQKICTIYIKKEFRYMGLGSLLIEEAMNWLQTKTPLITFPKYKLSFFLPIINKYKWQISTITDYENNTTEEIICNEKAFNEIEKNVLSKRLIHKNIK